MATIQVNLTPQQVNISGVRAGDTNPIGFTLSRAGAPMDLTGCTVTAQARKSSVSAGPLDADVDLDPDPTTGKVTVRWDGDAVRALLAGKSNWSGIWDLQVDSGADVQTVAAGTFVAVMDVTREEDS